MDPPKSSQIISHALTIHHMSVNESFPIHSYHQMSFQKCQESIMKVADQRRQQTIGKNIVKQVVPAEEVPLKGN